MKNYAVIVAGGKGTRMGTALPKQFLVIDEKPIIIATIAKFLRALEAQLSIIIVLNKHYVEYTKKLLKTHFSTQEIHRIQICEGGETRFHSVKNGMDLIPAGNGKVLIHDSVRPFLSIKLIEYVLKATTNNNVVLPAISLTDSVRQFVDSEQKDSLALTRANLRAVQTPQCFSITLAKKAYIQQYKAHFTDSASVLENLNTKVVLVEGEQNNIKITKPLDVIIAKELSKQGLF